MCSAPPPDLLSLKDRDTGAQNGERHSCAERQGRGIRPKRSSTSSPKQQESRTGKADSEAGKGNHPHLYRLNRAPDLITDR